MTEFKADKATLADFLENFMAPADASDPFGPLVPVYKETLQRIANRQETVLRIDLDDVTAFTGSEALAHRVEGNAMQYLELAAEAADAAMPEPTSNDVPEDAFDVLAAQRARAAELEAAERLAEGGAGAGGADGGGGADAVAALPASLTRRHEVLFAPRRQFSETALRRVSAPCVGKLVAFRGVVTQVTAVRPLLSVATYLDDSTGFEIYQEVPGRTFMPLDRAPAAVRDADPGGTSELHFQPRGSRFVKLQEARVQELPGEVPPGSTPRSLRVQLRGSLARSVRAGDRVRVCGALVPEPVSGGGGGGGGRGSSSASASAAGPSGLLATTYVRAFSVERSGATASDLRAAPAEARAAERLARRGDAYARLARSVAPEIWGHEDVKKALLTALAGGVARTLRDGMRIRGDVHVCLVGDPGVAKSQLLRAVAALAPRAVYATGRGSSGAGLTAAVVRDPVTGELVLEGGALVLADRGVACIDEFDKMDEADRTALHEAMEQQTVSIAKAGIAATLNTRASVLAAANPAYGRYDPRRSPAENINLPAALLSRFDVLWLVLDKPDREADLKLARHVLNVHRTGNADDAARESGAGPRAGKAEGDGAPSAPLAALAAAAAAASSALPENAYDALVDDEEAPLPPGVLKAYLQLARSIRPTVPPSLHEHLAAVYAETRRQEAMEESPRSYTTARTLLSFVRLAQALARLRFARAVERADVDEALRLLRASKASLDQDDGRGGPGGRRRIDPVSEVFAKIRQRLERDREQGEGERAEAQRVLTWSDILHAVGTAHKPETIRQCLRDYAAINVWQLHGDDGNEPSITVDL